MTSRFFIVTIVIFSKVYIEAAGKLQYEENFLTEIFLRLYTGNNLEQFTDVPLDEIEKLMTLMDHDKPTMIYIHGYTGSVRSRDVITVMTAYLKRDDHNSIAVDWSPIAAKNYPIVVRNAETVGRSLARAINGMIDNGLSSERIHLVGHSMGAQVAGYVGRFVSSQLFRITGLDPAGPFFNFLETHLASGDAKFVDTIHTDAGFYGISRSSGSASFYPNSGKRVQPGCPTSYELSSLEDYCSHHRSWVYYAESVTKENSFLATNCTSYNRFSNGICDENKKVVMGYATPINTIGTFYLTTRNESPYGLQEEGALSSFSKCKSKNRM